MVNGCSSTNSPVQKHYGAYTHDQNEMMYSKRHAVEWQHLMLPFNSMTFWIHHYVKKLKWC